MSRRLAWLALAAAGVLAAGCPRQKAEPGAGPVTGPGGGPAGPTAGTVIAVIPKGTSQSFWLAVKKGAEDAAGEAGIPAQNVKWNGPDSETQVDRQIQIVQSAIAQKVNAIVMAACDARSLVPYVEQAKKAGIPVVVIDSGLDPDVSDAFLATDNVKGGEVAADALAEAVGAAGGKVGLIPFIKTAASSDERERGFKQGLTRHAALRLDQSRIQYSNADVGEALRKTQAMLLSNPDLAGIFAANQAGAEGAIQAVKQAGKAGKVKLVCFDASDPEVAALRDGTVSALIVQNPYRMGSEGVRTALRLLKGEKVEPRKIDTGVTQVTKANVDTPEVRKLLNPTAP